MTAYYNEFDPFAAQWLRNLIDAGHIAPGDVDERDIREVQPDDIKRYTQVHFFAGIGGWSYALRLAGWPDDRPVWTGSCPCQPFSSAGKQLGTYDPRHLWPEMFRLIRECRPAIVFGEQVASKDGEIWLDGVLTELAGENYQVGVAILGAHSVGAPHKRQRIYLVADSASDGQERVLTCASAQIQKNRTPETLGSWDGSGSPFEHWREFLAESFVCRMDDGISSTVDIRPRLHAYGNAIVPQVAAEFIAAYMEVA